MSHAGASPAHLLVQSGNRPAGGMLKKVRHEPVDQTQDCAARERQGEAGGGTLVLEICLADSVRMLKKPALEHKERSQSPRQ